MTEMIALKSFTSTVNGLVSEGDKFNVESDALRDDLKKHGIAKDAVVNFTPVEAPEPKRRRGRHRK